MSSEIPRIQRVISILWPSFLTSGLATILFFTLFDPVHLLAGTALAELSRLGAYSIGFFCFWGLTILTSGLTCYFSQPCDDNRRRTRGRQDDSLGSAL
ncbi:hypothetical protein [Thiohalobacter thiocyanaticus]|uniref:Uncharacterized protein n=1 Tax=Thiohalobacter thiocyanaticus TaxID=585455 RepID=A0A426QJB7_9GAMM|nr:hypothetical protein [Thiohalobacter thiocyanaticus]RRQ21806.1 hypothetical protein D6C00_07500 [Thiohalobacter thiocyanaticus]